MQPRHFITLLDLSSEEFRSLIARAIELKKNPITDYQPLTRQTLAMIFEKSSTRTRVSFSVAMTQFGGQALFLSSNDTQLGRGEPVEDSARVISSMVDCIMLRTHSHDTVVQFAKYSKVPVINGLTELYHPCQLLADMQTYFEHRGDIQGKTVTWIGDGNNMCHSYINAARLLDFKLRIASPEGYHPEAAIVSDGGDRISIMNSVESACEGADLLVTDVWASMGQEQEQQKRCLAFADYQVTEALMNRANKDALFMHCLPAHRGEEVSATVIDATNSVVWDEAENRLHAQKALLELLLKN